MRRILLVLIIAMIMPQMPVSASEDSFDFFIDDEVVIHPGETVPFRIAWHNIVGFERHFQINVNQSHSNLTIDEIPVNWTRVASGRLGEMNINLTVASNSNFETIQFSLDITCQEVPEWKETHEIDVLVSRWSSLNFGANDGSSFYVQQNVNTSLAVNISNSAGYEDSVTIRMNTPSNWQYGFVDDMNNDNEVLIDLLDGDDVFVYFWIITPKVQDGAPLAGTGPTFTLEAVSGLDRRVESWTFGLEMQTFHNMSIDDVDENLSLDPGDTGRIEVTVRNNGNIDTFLDASLRIGSLNDDRIEVDGWTIALFNAFESQSLAPNESRLIEIGFESPNVNDDEIEVELIIKPEAFPQRVNSITMSSSINWERGGVISSASNPCYSVLWNQTCQQMIQIENTGNFYEEYSLQIVDENGMSFEITSEIIGLSKDQLSSEIPLNLTPLVGAEGLLPASANLELRRSDGTLVDSIAISSSTAPNVNWICENASDSVNNGKLEVSITMRNDGNTADGLVVRMTSSYYTDMSFIPPDNAIVEDGSSNIRSFEVINNEKGENFTFRAWAKIPNDQGSDDDFYLNITAHSRLAEENPFLFSANSSFDAAISVEDDESSVVNSITDLISSFFSIIWAWKWILVAALVSGLMINKSLRDRQLRLDEAALNNPVKKDDEQPDDWMAEFANKKQAVPEPAQSPEIPSEVFTGMFQAVGGERKPTAEPVDSQLVGAANTVLDHHDTQNVKSKMNVLASDIAGGDISRPHSANVALPDDIVPVTERTVPVVKEKTAIPEMLDLDDLDL
ncbi:MAG: hypothetical protein CMA11_04830 [Euryarchaeota archaeon]|nr:hypothetical protein [Euryarchaeota archaeon]